VAAPVHPRPVVLVHGTGANGVDNWLGLTPYLVDRGWCVCSFDYGELLGLTALLDLIPGLVDRDALRRDRHPYESQFINEPGVKNVLIQDLCPLDLSEHATIGLADPVAWHEVVNALDPANAEPTTCLN
jgi:hypothetical protein